MDHASIHVAKFSIFRFGAAQTASAPSSSTRNLLGVGSAAGPGFGGSRQAISTYSIRFILSMASGATCAIQAGVWCITSGNIPFAPVSESAAWCPAGGLLPSAAATLAATISAMESLWAAEKAILKF